MLKGAFAGVNVAKLEVDGLNSEGHEKSSRVACLYH